MTRQNRFVRAAAARERRVVHGARSRARSARRRPAMPSTPHTCRVTASLSPVTTLTATPCSASAAQRGAALGLGRVGEGGEAGEHQFALVGRRDVRSSSATAASGDARAPGSPRAAGSEAARAMRARAASSSGARACPRRLDAAAQAQHVLRGALDDQQPRPRRARAAPRRGAARSRTATSSILRQRAASTVPCARIASSSRTLRPVSKWLLSQASSSTRALSRPVGVDTPLERELRFGQRAGLVGAQHVHRAEVVHRRQPLDDDLLAAIRSAPRASVTETTIGSSSGVRPDRQRHREQERLEQRPLVERVDQQHEQDQQDRQPRQQDARIGACRVRTRSARRLGQRARRAGRSRCARRCADQQRRRCR